MALGAIVGAGSGFAVMRLALHLHVQTKTLTWADFLGFWLGVTFFGIGLILFGISFSRRELAENIEGESAKLPATDQEVHAYRLQAGTLTLAGAMLLLLLLARGVLGESRGAQEIVFAVIVAFFAVQTVVNVLVWRVSDEFLRGQMMIVGAVTFAIGQGALFLWTAAERLHLARAATSWEIETLLLTLYLVTGAIVSIRNRPSC
jgi:hypothetical protein